jgi:hypothetical protein
MAWAGIVGATLATAGARLDVTGLAVLTAVTCALGAVRLRSGDRAEPAPAPSRGGVAGLAVGLAALATLAVFSVFALSAFRVRPLLEYDGWAMWGMKARAIAVLGSADDAVFASDAYERLHLEYPLLLPALLSLPLQLADGFSSSTIVLMCLAMGVAGVLAIWGILRDRVRAWLLLVFLAAIATLPTVVGQLGTGYADVPLALFVAGGLCAAARWLEDEGNGWLALATVFLAAAVLTKNEGLLFAVAVYVPLLLIGRRRRPIAVSAAVVALLYAPWRIFMAVHDFGTPDYDLTSSLNLPWVVGRLDRAPVAARALLEKAFGPEQFGLVLALGLALIVLSLVLRLRPGQLAAGFAVISFLGLTWIYVLSVNELPSYLRATAHRVVVSLVVAVAALSPLLVEECARALAVRRRARAGAGAGAGAVGTQL